MLVSWIRKNGKESPLYECFDEILDVLAAYDVTISLGDGMRPGATCDATDRAQISELITLGELTQRAWAKGVQVMIEGPGHVPLSMVAENMKLEKQLCHGAPFYVGWAPWSPICLRPVTITSPERSAERWPP